MSRINLNSIFITESRFSRSQSVFDKVAGTAGNFSLLKPTRIIAGGGGSGKVLSDISNLIVKMKKLHFWPLTEESFRIPPPKGSRLLDVAGMRSQFQILKEAFLDELKKTPLTDPKIENWQIAYRILLETDFKGAVSNEFSLTLADDIANSTLSTFRTSHPARGAEVEKFLIFYLLSRENKLAAEAINYLGLPPQKQQALKEEYAVYSILWVGEKELREDWERFLHSQIPSTKDRFSQGDLIGKYKIIAELAQGGMGIIYKAEDLCTREIVALKILKGNRPDDRLYFQYEVQAIKTIKDKTSFVEIKDVSICLKEQNGKIMEAFPYMACEFVEGRDLSDYLAKKRKLPPKIAVSWMIKICRAIKSAHDDGIIHLDLKPDNIRITLGDIIKIMDFGIAKIFLYSLFSADKLPRGLPAYVSPEHFNREAADERADIYSLGVIFYKMLMGGVPSGDEEKFTFSGPVKFDPAIPLDPDLKKIIHQMLEKDPAARYQNADELLEVLIKYEAAAAEQSVPIRIQSPGVFPCLSGIERVKHFSELTSAISSLEAGPAGELFAYDDKGLVIRDKNWAKIGKGDSWKLAAGNLGCGKIAINQQGELFAFYEVYPVDPDGRYAEKELILARYDKAGNLKKEIKIAKVRDRVFDLFETYAEDEIASGSTGNTVFPEYFSQMKALAKNLVVLNEKSNPNFGSFWADDKDLKSRYYFQILNTDLDIIREKSLDALFPESHPLALRFAAGPNDSIWVAPNGDGQKQIIELDSELNLTGRKIEFPEISKYNDILSFQFEKTNNIFVVDRSGWAWIYDPRGKFLYDNDEAGYCREGSQGLSAAILALDPKFNFYYVYYNDSNWTRKKGLIKNRIIYRGK